jgi:hypothetical protein
VQEDTDHKRISFSVTHVYVCVCVCACVGGWLGGWVGGIGFQYHIRILLKKFMKKYYLETLIMRAGALAFNFSCSKTRDYSPRQRTAGCMLIYNRRLLQQDARLSTATAYGRTRAYLPPSLAVSQTQIIYPTIAFFTVLCGVIYHRRLQRETKCGLFWYWPRLLGLV